MERRDSVIAALAEITGPKYVISDRAELRTYECDGLMGYRAIPSVAVLPDSAREVQLIVRMCAERQLPFVARGAGTGLSGGALPVEDGILIVLTRMRRIVEVDIPNLRVVVEPAVSNLAVTEAVSASGHYYAPDPSSQQICSIGGNLAENAGGAHCLKYGFTANHVTGAEVVLPTGELVHLGSKALDVPGYDLLGALVGSEGTLGIATKITLRIVRKPETVATLLAAFDGPDSAGAAVSAIVAAGIIPAAVEMMDALAIAAAEAAVHPGYPPGAGAVLIVELDGPELEVGHQFRQVQTICRASGCSHLHVAADEAERSLIWKGRKSAFAAVGRISPDFLIQDGVIPRTKLGEVLGEIGKLATAHGLRVANVFHAGDGNLHPLVLYDSREPGQQERAEQLSSEILMLCLNAGGSLTGEHGVGADKKKYMSRMFTTTDLDTMQFLRCAFDPQALCNPGKVFPTPRLCGEVPGRYIPHPAELDGKAERF